MLLRDRGYPNHVWKQEGKRINNYHEGGEQPLKFWIDDCCEINVSEKYMLQGYFVTVETKSL